MDVVLLHFDGRPDWQVPAGRLQEASARAGRTDVCVHRRQVATTAGAEAVGFRGSPTVPVDGRDPFADPEAPVGLSCRVHRSATGPAGAPTVGQLLGVLR